MRIILYDQNIKEISGVKTATIELCKGLKYIYEDVSLVYDSGDVGEFEKIVNTIKNEGQVIKCDVCIYMSIFRNSENIKAKKYVQVVHADLKKFGVTQIPNADLYVAVSKLVQIKLQEDFNINATVIGNLIDTNVSESALKLITISRIEKGKGFNRVVKMAKILRHANVSFLWDIYGGGKLEEWFKEETKDIKEVVLRGVKKDAKNFIKGYDYLVQLSDSEGYCYSVYDALLRSVPVIILDWENYDKRIDNFFNGIKLKEDLSNLDVEKIKGKVKTKEWANWLANENENNINLWEKVLKWKN